MDAALKLRVMAATDIAERVRMIELAAVDGELPPFTAGSHIEFTTATGLSRSYSLANDPRERHRYVIAVLRDGPGSAWMHDEVKAGDMLEASPPRNGFALDEAATEHVLVAGGIGITPLRSMAYHLRATGGRFRVLYCTRTPETTAFGEELAREFGDAVTVHHDGGDLSRAADLAALLADRPAGAHLYVCGPRGMIEAARKAAAHWPADAVHFELFASPAAPVAVEIPPAGGDVPFEVELRRSGIVIMVGADQTILQAMLAAGVKAPHVCKEGWCGNCQLTLLEGRADHRDEVLSDDEKAANTAIQTCISRAAPGERRLVIDR